MPPNRVLVFILLMACVPCFGQKLLQLEKAGSLKTMRFYIGDEITFQLFNDDVGWYTRTIYDIDVENRTLVLENYVLPIDSISMLQLPKSKAWQTIGTALQYGGVGLAISSVSISIVQDQPLDWTGIGTSLGSAALGTAMKYGMRKKKFKIGKNKRLRVLDLSFGPPIRLDKS